METLQLWTLLFVLMDHTGLDMQFKKGITIQSEILTV